ncbi:Ribosomal protein L34Ae [Melia azedarach]|uniref:Ribosomal protein L34Ae n=1 Tax=Melia azedarach TaxID=155640 RepID=A0ACC1XR91_MELAZ|nr:Ribosomal protein L34Ae [Melia azedarach]
MQCSEETLARFFYNVSSFSFLFILFFHYSFICLAKFFHFVGSYPLIQRTQNENDYSLFSEEEEEGEEEYNDSFYRDQDHVQEFVEPQQEHVVEDQDESFDTAQHSEHDDDVSDVREEQIPARDNRSGCTSDTNNGGSSFPVVIDLHNKSVLVESDESSDENCDDLQTEISEVEKNAPGQEKIFVFAATQLESKKLSVQEKDIDNEEIFGDSCTVGSTSKSSSEWRSSITYRDSGVEDPFSSSSRRSCPKWESYTVFQKYDEEMMFLDRVSAQKLHETESLKSIQVNPRSISERIVHKFAVNKKPADIRHNPYHELEAAYVAQICLTWEALNWNYKNFQRKLSASRREFGPGCPAHIAQQFQQFQVLLQRYIENEPYEQGRRPEVYARMRLLAPKLLLVPEYRDSEDDQKDDSFASRISSAAFIMIMEDGIRTFMNFLKADKEKPCQIIKSFFGRNRRASVDPTLLHLMKKVNNKKKTKLKDLRRCRKCIRKKRLTVEEEVEIMMGLIDLQVVSRVLRMTDISEEQLHWCEEKMSKVSILEGKLQRDSSPLFFPAH